MVDKADDSQHKRSSTLNGSRSPESKAGGSRRLSSYLQSVAQISGVVTIIAATVYALGVFTLVLPIANSYNSTFPAAWYAVSVVPKTVVVGHGIRSLLWPSLALMVATMLFALMVLWVLYIMSLGWRHARQTASQHTLNLTSLAVIYSLFAVLIAIGFQALWPAWVRGSGLELPSRGDSPVAFYTQRSLTFMSVPVDILIVLLCSAITVLVVARGVRYTRRVIASRAFPSLSFRGFIIKSFVLVWLSVSYLGSLSRLEDSFVQKLHLYKLFNSAWFDILSFVFLLLAFVTMLLLILSASRFILKMFKETKRHKALPSPSTALAGLDGSGWPRIRAFAPTLLYSAVLFLVFYAATLVALNVLYSFVIPLIDNTSEGIRSESWLDECFIPLVVLGAFISLAIMYRKGWRGLGRGEYDLFSQGGWLSFSTDLLRSIGSRSLRSGLFWSLGVAYAVALASAFLLAELHPPPLPKVEVSEVPQPQSVRSGEVPAFQGKRLALLAHTDGYWYLIDEDENHLLVVPDQDDQFIRLRLDEQP